MLTLGVWATVAFASDPVKRALLIGIDKYKSQAISTLGGSVNDVELMRTVLIGKFEFAHVTVLKNEQATRQAILDAIKRDLIDANPPSDIAVIHFSGHGSQMLDVSGDEDDGWDETIVPYDSRTDGIFDISDDEINGLLEELAKHTKHVTLIMDSCHSGSLARAAEIGAAVRQAPRDTRIPPRPPAPAGTRTLVEGPSGFRVADAKYVLISGSQANELSNEAFFDGRRHGALTYFLTKAMLAAGKSTTYRDVIYEVATNVSARFPGQHPDFEGTHLDNALFNDQQVLTRPYVIVEQEGPARVKLGAGDILGIRPGALLDVYPPGTKQFDGTTAATARIRITEVGPFQSFGEIVGPGTVRGASRAVLNEIAPADFSLAVYIADTGTSRLMKGVAQGLASIPSIKVVENRAEAQLRVELRNSYVTIEGRDLDQLFKVESTQAEAVQQTIDRIMHLSRWYAVLAIGNPNPDIDVDLRVRRKGSSPSDPAPEVITAGTDVEIIVSNRSSRDLYITVLDLASDGSICVLYPSTGNCRAAEQSDVLTPGRDIVRTIGSSLPEGRPRVTDVIKLLATTQKIPARAFELGPAARDVDLAPRTAENALERYLRLSMQGHARNLSSLTVDGWATKHRRLQVVRPEVRMTSIALHVAPGKTPADLTSGLTASRAVCVSPQDVGCYDATPLRGDTTIVEVRTPRTRGGSESVRSVGEAFEDAYRLQQETGALRAEPMLELELEGVLGRPRDPATDTRGVVAENHDPRAEADALWSLKHVRANEAWAKVRAVNNKPHGEEAQGIVVAHPDTGYLKHPEIWNADASRRAVWPEMGYDYFGEDDDPSDDLLDGQALDNPAHGTGSGSAIISPEGCQLTGAVKCPTGLALGARIVPLRVNRSVVQFSTKRLTQVILDASGPDRTRLKIATDVMSISMGGVPSWSLWKAVKKAEESGYLIIAAAGNYIGTVVWPARFESVIAVAATNVGCRPWAHTSMGEAVAFSAPGESVWRATIDDQKALITGMGVGTTYATATTAGAAALWLARHANEPKLAELKHRGLLTKAFREAAQATSWRPDRSSPANVACDPGAGWQPTRLGPGILDAAGLIDAPLTDPSAPRDLESQSLAELPLWNSVYARGTPRNRIMDDYARLLSGSPAINDSLATYEAEVMYHYATDIKLRRAIDAIASEQVRSEDGFALAREALRQADLSSQLRNVLRTVR